MLKKIVVENYKIFKDRVEFDLEATKYQSLMDTNVRNGILKGALIVGANASGKSTLLSAVQLLLSLLFIDNFFVSPAEACLYSGKETIYFEFEFLIQGKKIKYLFETNTLGQILSEKLYVENEILLARNGMDGEIYDHGKKLKISQEKFAGNILLLKRCYFSSMFSNHEVVCEFMDFLRNSVYINAFYRTVISFNNDSLLVDKIDDDKFATLNKNFDSLNIGFTVEKHNINLKNQVINNQVGPMVFFKRKGLNFLMPMAFESSGNLALVNIMPAIDVCCRNKCMLIIDEFSSGMHNKLEESLLKFFFDCANESQIIFVSHSTNLLTTRILRPDQIYTVEYDEGTKSSFVKRFSDENPREAQNLEKMYLSGKFGGVPKYDYDN